MKEITMCSGLFIVGEALIDFIPEQKGKILKDAKTFKRVVGGAPVNVAIAYGKLRGYAKVLSKLGDDSIGKYIIEVRK